MAAENYQKKELLELMNTGANKRESASPTAKPCDLLLSVSTC